MDPYSIAAMKDEKKIGYVQDAKTGNSERFNLAEVKKYYKFLDVEHSFLQNFPSIIQLRFSNYKRWQTKTRPIPHTFEAPLRPL